MPSFFLNGSSTVSRGRGVSVYICFLMLMGSIWTAGNLGMPGQGDRRGAFVDCEECPEDAVKQPDGYYKCRNGHRFRRPKDEEGEGRE
jgi:hypothetical protein